MKTLSIEVRGSHLERQKLAIAAIEVMDNETDKEVKQRIADFVSALLNNDDKDAYNEERYIVTDDVVLDLVISHRYNVDEYEAVWFYLCQTRVLVLVKNVEEADALLVSLAKQTIDCQSKE